jgi:biofilm PGA synthesis protein PgaA
MMGRGTLWLACVLGLVLGLRGHANAWSEVLDSAVRDARDGRTEMALQTLAALHETHPDIARIRHDYAVVAAWAEDDGRVALLLDDTRIERLPTYVIEVYAKSLRNLGRWQHARDAYRVWQSRQPDSFDARIGLVLTEADAESYDAAAAHLEAIDIAPLDTDRRTAYYLACGYVQERQGTFVAALDCYNRGLRQLPDSRDLLRQRAVVASALGASQYARDTLLALGDVDRQTLNDVQLDATALRVRWLHLEPAGARQRPTADVLQAFARLDGLTPRQERVRQFDALVGEVAGYRMDDALVRYRALLAEVGGLAQIPSYVLGAVGQALLHTERAHEAVQVYRAAITNLGNAASADARFDYEVGLFHALSDAGRLEDAQALAQRLDQAQTPWIRPTDRLWLENNRYIVAREVGALGEAYADRYAAALGRFEALLDIAPANDGLRLSSAIVKRWRGLHRRSQADAEKVHGVRYRYPRAVLEGQLAIDRYDYDGAAQALKQARLLHPTGKSTIDLQRRLEIQHRPEVVVSAGFAQSEADQIGAESFYVDTRYFGGLQHGRWRPFAHSHYRQAEFSEGLGRDHRLGAGAQYFAPYWSISAELNRGIEQNEGTGAVVEHSWRSTDHLSHDTRLSWNSVETPLRGTRGGIESDALSHSTTLRWHEAGRATVGFSVADYDDGNERHSAHASVLERVINQTRHKLSVLGSLYASRNSESGTAYYNPERDVDVRVGLMHEWRMHRDYRTRHTLRSQIWYGNYHQRGFGSDGLWQVGLEYEHNLDEVFDLLLGVRVGRRPYDGVQEREEEVYMTVRARP